MTTETYRDGVSFPNYLASNHSGCPWHDTKKKKENNIYRLGLLTREIYHSWVAEVSVHALWESTLKITTKQSLIKKLITLPAEFLVYTIND